MTTTALFTADDLNDLPNVSGVDEAEAAAVERVVWGWLKPVLGLTERPDPVSEELFSWALELGVIYRANPEGISSYHLESERTDYSSERRDEILRTAATGGATAPGAALAPKSSFPPARRFPDSSDRFASWWW